jgi:LytS/YehU family sensor histidine kinase
MHQDVEAADRMIARLSDLLRAALDSSDAQEVTLQRELSFLERYLELEKTRFGDRLMVKMVAAPETLEAQVPNLILQPLVENAIRHGIEPHARPGRIDLRAQRQGDRLVLEVQDNGNGLASAAPGAEGVGLSNTRARLRTLYGEAHRFQLSNTAQGGLLVQMSFPFRVATNNNHEDANPDR